MYPPTRAGHQVDEYHGVRVSDPYRWLEDEASSDRQAWIDAQNATTEAFLSRCADRPALRRRFDELLNYPRHYDFVRRGPHLLFLRNDGRQKQLVLCLQRGEGSAPEIVLDPTTFDADGTTRISEATLSPDGRYVAYGISRGGSDWHEYLVKDLVEHADLPDHLRWVKLSAIAWSRDGFYYNRYPVPTNPDRALTERNERHQVWYHRLGTQQSADRLVYDDAAHPLRFHFVQTVDDGRFGVLAGFDHGAGRSGNTLSLVERCGDEHHFRSIVTSFEDAFRFVDYRYGGVFVVTDRGAPRWRLVRIDPDEPGEDRWQEIIPQRSEALEYVIAAAGKLFACYSEDAAHRVLVFDYDGVVRDELATPSLGVVRVFQGQWEDTDVFWSFTSFTTPPTIYRYNVETRDSSAVYVPSVPFDVHRFEVQRAFYASRDGTRIPLFIVHARGLRRDGSHRMLLYAYGGNGTSVGPAFDPLLVALLERDVVYAVACVRGGGEYGEEWHRAGWREKKQNAFDDCIAAAEWLEARGLAHRERSALIGSSNGGLLVGAVMVQRPDLFKVALPGAPPMDMLRFQHFTVGWSWEAEYGASDDPAMFPILRAYSPLHNIRPGVTYPATLITTSQHDDRVVPSHAFKFIATLQRMGAGPNPYLIRIDTKSGHAPVSLPKLLDERADIYAFLLAQTPEASVRDPLAPLR